MGKLPAIQFYPGDWLQDGVSGCSLQAQGLWLNLLFMMHSSERRGYLVVNGRPMSEQFVVNKVGSGLTVDLFRTLLAELIDAGVPERTNDGLLFSRRMVRDERERHLTRARVAKHRSNGDVTADVTLEKRPCTEDEDEDEVEAIDVVVDLKEPNFPEIIYASYPRKVGKAAALKSIGKAISKIQKLNQLSELYAAEYLHKAVLEYSRSPAGNRGEFTPHCATWMNQERWLDDRAQWQLDDRKANGKASMSDFQPAKKLNPALYQDQ